MTATIRLTAYSIRFAFAALAVAAAAGSTAGLAAADTVRPQFGCFKVTKDVAIKKAAIGTSQTLATADKGEILIKRRRFCYTLGTMCAVTKLNGIEGYADRTNMRVAPCPAKLSVKIN